MVYVALEKMMHPSSQSNLHCTQEASGTSQPGFQVNISYRSNELSPLLPKYGFALEPLCKSNSKGWLPANQHCRHHLAPDSLQTSLGRDLLFSNHPTHFQSSSKSLIASFFLPCFSLKLAASLISDKWTGDFG